jgi:Uncharacterized protein conserved in bacteria (DUF2252)
MIADISTSTARYEEWLRKRLRGRLVEDDLKKKHKKMQAGPFPFLRATCWRWAEIIQSGDFEIVTQAPEVQAVGDIHLENYGVWRDLDGRLVWGVNDFDEAAEMPYVCDLLRLAVSAALAPVAWSASTSNICASVLRGYRDGLKAPRAFVLDRDNVWLRRQFEVDDGERGEFWAKIDAQRQKAKDAREEARKKSKRRHGTTNPPDDFHDALLAALPRGSCEPEFWPSDAGGGPVIREAKAVVPSAWAYAAGTDTNDFLCAAVARGRFRAPDPCYRLSNHLVLRRLSPNSRKLEVEDYGAILVDPRMLRLMGHELANVHLGTAGNWQSRSDKIKKHLKAHRHGTFAAAVDKLVDRVIADQAAYIAAA